MCLFDQGFKHFMADCVTLGCAHGVLLALSRKEVKTGPTGTSMEKCRHLVDPNQNSSEVIITCMTK